MILTYMIAYSDLCRKNVSEVRGGGGGLLDGAEDPAGVETDRIGTKDRRPPRLAQVPVPMAFHAGHGGSA